ncbi:hypothetical protein HispidOSU_027400 [Sigmodon hispidus]
MASEAEPRPLGMFECQLCALTVPYSYVGQKPPDTQAVVLLEESYIMKDPFSSDKESISAFPQEIQQDVEKRKGGSKKSSSHP